MGNDLQALAAERWDVVLVGAGPAGAVAAYLLAGAGCGWRVLLVERSAWPREKSCGGCLNAAAVGMLCEMGLGEALEGAMALRWFEVHLGRETLRVPLPPGAAVARREFDARLVKAAEGRGVVFVDQTVARLLPGVDGEESRLASLKRGGEAIEVEARVVIAADGVRGGLMEEEPGGMWLAAADSRIGVSMAVPDDGGWSQETIAMLVGKAGYVGVVRQGEGKVHIGGSLDPAACNRARGPANVVLQILQQCGKKVQGVEVAEIAGTRPLTGRRAAVAGDRVLAIGDACGYVEPFTGEGISWAIRGARAAVDLLPENLDEWPLELEAAWGELYRSEILRRQRWCRWFRAATRRPVLAGCLMGVAQQLPWVPALLARRISA